MDTVPPTTDHTHTVILLHNRDSTASEFKQDFFESESSDGQTLTEIFPGIKWIFPSADMVYSRRYRTHLSQWFDMWKMERPHEREDEQDLLASTQRICQIVQREARCVGAQNVFLGGLCQGAAVAVHSLLVQTCRLGGFIALSTWLPKRDRVLAYSMGRRETCQQLQTPVLVLHNQDDDTIDIRYGEEFRDMMKDVGLKVNWHAYENGGHWLNEPEGVDDLVRWMARRMGRRSVDESSRQARSKSLGRVWMMVNHGSDTHLPGLKSQSAQQDYLSVGAQREVQLLARRIHENMPEERRQELHMACMLNRREDLFVQPENADPVEKFCIARAQRQWEQLSDLEGKMKLINAS